MSKQVWTPSGLLNGPTRSLVGLGEVPYSPQTQEATVITKGSRVGVDDQPSSISSSDNNAILGNDIDYMHYDGRTFAEKSREPATRLHMTNLKELKFLSNIKKYGHLDSMLNSTTNTFNTLANILKQPDVQALELTRIDQENQHKIMNRLRQGGLLRAKCGKDIEFFKDGTEISPWMRGSAYALPIALNGILALYWGNLKPHTPNIYVGNPYESRALNTLSGLRINPYQVINEMRNSARRNAYEISRAGGLTGGLRYAALANQAIGTQSNIAKALFDVQSLNNAYRSDWAKSALSTGDARALRMQAANQYAAQAYDAANAARKNNMWKSIAGVGAAAGQAFNNEFKYDSYRYMKNLYDRDMDLRTKEWLSKQHGNDNNSYAYTIGNTILNDTNFTPNNKAVNPFDILIYRNTPNPYDQFNYNDLNIA